MNHDRYRALLADAGEAFANDTRNHGMQVLHDDGLYRHLRFRADGSLTGFDLITWPGSLTIQGGHGTYTFRRETDMFGFFRASNGINVDYWAEKVPNGRDSVKEYSEEALLRRLVEVYTEHGRRLDKFEAAYEVAMAAWNATPANRRYPYDFRGPREPVKPRTVAELRQQVADARRDGLLADEDSARRFLSGWDDANVTSDSWEWDLREYDYHFVWSCHAIRWGVRRYDEAKAAAVQVGELAGATQ